MSKYRIKLNGKVYEMEIERIDGQPQAAAGAPAPAQPIPQRAPAAPQPAAKAQPAAGADTKDAGGSGRVTSPMPGTILRVYVGVGDPVKKGQPVITLEAMKMENEIAAPMDGVIASLYVAQGDAVQGGAPLFDVSGGEAGGK